MCVALKREKMDMFDKIKSIFSKNNSQKAINEKLSSKLHNMHVKYITEKDASGEEIIIGRNGHINIVGDKSTQLCATCGVKTVFRLLISEMNIWEFMSLDGCVITFTALDTGDKRTVTVYYDKHLT